MARFLFVEVGINSQGAIAMQIHSLRFVQVRNPEGGAHKRYHVLANENGLFSSI